MTTIKHQDQAMSESKCDHRYVEAFAGPLKGSCESRSKLTIPSGLRCHDCGEVLHRDDIAVTVTAYNPAKGGQPTA